jgi:hypothetical protein
MTGVYLIFEKDSDYTQWNEEQGKLLASITKFQGVWGRSTPLPKDAEIAAKKIAAMIKKCGAFK